MLEAGWLWNLRLEQSSGAGSVQCQDADIPCHTPEFPSAEKEGVKDLRFLVALFGFH